jgi:integrase
MPKICKTDLELIEKNHSVSILKNRMIVRENKSMQTLKRYIEGIQEFTRFLNAGNPDQALEIFSKTEDRTGKLDQFIDYMILNGKSPIDIKAKWHGVKKWLISNRVNNIDWDYISKPKAVSQIQDRIPTPDELRLILDNRVCLRDKALFLVIASAGFRLGTAITLKVKNYKPIEDLGMITVEGSEGRKLAIGKSYFTFITPEARRFLEEYLKTRQPLSPDAPLFASESKSFGNTFEYSGNASRQWTILVKKAKLLEKAPNSRNFTLHGHSLRKFFQTHCKLAGCRADFVDFWMGHHPQGANQYLNDSYFRPEIKDHITEYRKAISHLQVFQLDQSRIYELESETQLLKQQLTKQSEQLSALLSIVYQKIGNPETYDEDKKEGDEFLSLVKSVVELQTNNMLEFTKGKTDLIPPEDILEALTKELKRIAQPYQGNPKMVVKLLNNRDKKSI